MRIGVMLRAIGERQGIGIYTRNLMDKLLPLDRDNHYILFYRSPEYLGRYATHPNATEKLIPAANKALWDQVSIPLEARRERLDLVFHPKFTVPFFTVAKTVMTVHGASWFVHPELYGRLDIAYIRAVMPLYCRRANAIIANSELTRSDFIRLLGVSPAKIHTIYLGTNEQFRVIEDRSVLEAVRRKHALPDRFILSVIKYDPRKNFKNLVAAFRILRGRIPCKLVVVGIGCEKYIAECRLDSDGTANDITFLGWLDNSELPALYNLATCLFFPSVYEEFGIPTCEAMACGCPVVVSKTGALPEIAGDAGLTVDPFNPEEMADALEKIWKNEELRENLAERGLARAPLFTWQRCAQETLKVLHSVCTS